MDDPSPRARGRYDPASPEPYRLSRTKLELFLECPRCFHLDRRLGIQRPDGPPFSLNLAVDRLLKREFDLYRARGEPHPMMTWHGVDAVPLRHRDLDRWREAARGVQWLHRRTSFLVFGALDDVWAAPDGSLAVVDYKATSTPRDITLEGEWKGRYKRQVETYQWLLRREGHAVSDRAYFVFANAEQGRRSFDGRLEFAMHVLPYDGSDAWVEDALVAAKECLSHEKPPPFREGCEWCAYRRLARGAEKAQD